MNFDPIDLHHGSNITYTIRRWARETRPFISIVHLAFIGTYRSGSAGAPDAHYMSGILAIVDGVWRPSAIILDLSSLAYEWGDDMEILLPSDGGENAVIVGAGSRRALSTLSWGVDTTHDITELPNFFDSFDAAHRYVAERKVESWTASIDRSNPSEQDELITLADLGIL